MDQNHRFRKLSGFFMVPSFIEYAAYVLFLLLKRPKISLKRLPDPKFKKMGHRPWPSSSVN